jgi:hypothetical protein
MAYTLTSPDSADNTVRALATPPRERNTGAMPIFNSTPVYRQHNTCVEVMCWTCQRPIMRVASQVRRIRQRTGMHYCSLLCYRKAVEWRRIARVWSNISLEGECWIWQGSINKTGYGTIRVDPRNLLVHRYVYEMVRGPIPATLGLDHLCRTPACMNPAHLEAVTTQVNTARGLYATRTHCGRGHLYTPEITRITRKGWRTCLLCRRYRRQHSAQG